MKTGMRWARVMLLGAVSAMAIAACTGDDDDDGSFPTLESGTYTFTATGVVAVDDCWPSTADPAVVGVPVPMTVTVLNSTGFTLAATGTAGGFLVPAQEVGLFDEDGFIQSQMGPVVGEPFTIAVHLNSACTIEIGANMAGEVTDGGFEASFYTSLAVAALNSAGTAAASCATHPATLFDGFVPFPEALVGAGTACGATSEGTAVLQ